MLCCDVELQFTGADMSLRCSVYLISEYHETHLTARPHKYVLTHGAVLVPTDTRTVRALASIFTSCPWTFPSILLTFRRDISPLSQ